VDPLSRNHNWSLPLVNLPGRAGLDLGLALTYNSLVWTKDATGVTFDADRGFPSPGFRLGFPVVQQRFVNPQIQQANQPVRYSYLLVTPSGARVELRQKVGSTNVYESADSSYLQLTDYGGGALQLISTDGTRLGFSLTNGEYQCREVTDRNGNYLTVNYAGPGQISTVVDTLGRVVTFNYDAFQNLISITQPWKREVEPNSAAQETHTWATFGYQNLTLQPSFSNLAVVGTQSGAVVPVLNQVGLSDGSYYRFEYNGWGQVYKITHYAADAVDQSGHPNLSHPLSSAWFNLPGAGASTGGAGAVPATAQADCPRFTERRDWVEHGVLGQSAEATTGYGPWSADMTSCEITPPDATPGPEDDQVVYEETYGAGWKRGLTTASEVRVGGQVRKTTAVTWEHDGAEADPRPTNPRVKQTTVSDPPTDPNSPPNGRTTRVEYGSAAEFRLPKKVEECNLDCSTVSRTTVTDYDIPNLGDYTALRIIGLPRFSYLYEGAASPSNLRSQVGYVYDEPDTATGVNDPDPTKDVFLVPLPNGAAAAQHYGAGYGATFRRRGNANRVRRYEVDQTNGNVSGPYAETRTSYNVTGTLAYTKDASGHKSSVSYEDKFWSATNLPAEINRNTFAYPTAVTDADGFQSTSRYNFDIGAVTYVKTPQPHSTVSQPEPVRRAFYDAAGRILKAGSDADNAYTRWVYPASMNYVLSFSTVRAGVESYSMSALDGAGRVRGVSGYLPPLGDTGTGAYAGNYTAQYFEYDALGRQTARSNPREVNGAWQPAGADDGTLWVYTRRTFDWKGRPLVTTNADGTTVEARYDGCGCAGGEVSVVRDEVGRRRKMSYDVLGRLVREEALDVQPKAEALDFIGSVYSTAVVAYNARDQVTSVRQYQGTEASGVYQETLTGYDGHGRLKSRRAPAQTNATAYSYNEDDTLSVVTDARGASTAYAYNKRHLATHVSYGAPASPPSPIPTPSPVTFEYDAAGNRKTMTDDAGSVSYEYDALSRVKKETRHFSALSASYPLTYQYNLAGQPTSITDHTGAEVGYTYDRAGLPRKVTGAGSGTVPQFASEIEYRAWGGLKKMTYGNGMRTSVSYDARLRAQQFEVKAVNQPGSPTKMLKQYSYYADGRTRLADDVQADRFDRAFSYDHVGRLKEAYTGGEARDFFNQTSGSAADGPYRQSYGYDVWGNTTGRENRFWSRSDTLVANYVNDRRQHPHWQYDAAGNVLNDTTLLYTYDAAGRNSGVSDNSTVGVAQWFDGDGRAVKRLEERLDENGQLATTETTYYVRSAMLGGRVALELNGQGVKAKGKVYLGGELIAEQLAGVEWKHQEPVTGSRGASYADGTFEAGAEFDPLGVSVGHFDPFNVPTLEPVMSDVPSLAAGPGTPSGRCAWDGIPILCDQAVALSSSAAVPCPDNDCGPRRVDGRWEPTTPRAGDQAKKPAGISGLTWVDDWEEYYIPGSSDDTYDEVSGLFRDGGVTGVNNVGYFVGGGGGAGGPRGALTSTRQSSALADKAAKIADMCRGVKAKDLDYDVPGQGGKTGLQHITERHITNDDPDYRNKSKYIFSSWGMALEFDPAKMLAKAQRGVKAFNASTFMYGNRDLQGNGNIVIVYGFPHNVEGPQFSVEFWVGQIGSGQKNHTSELTNVNTLVLRGDCRTVVTSFPGTPGGYSDTDPRIGGFRPAYRRP
jgi:YD repeat-containing protein